MEKRKINPEEYFDILIIKLIGGMKNRLSQK
jgi:hypothetical protein